MATPSPSSSSSSPPASGKYQGMVLSGLGIGLILYPEGHPVVASTGFSLLGFVIAYNMIPALGKSFINVGLKGRDLSKPHQPTIPEAMGVVTSLVYLFCMLFFIPYMFYKYLVTTTSGSGNRDEGVDENEVNFGRKLHLFPHNKLAEYLSALLCLQSMLILGVADDLFDIRWRNKFFLPAIAAIPLLIVYYVDFGVTQVMLPPFLNLGATIDLGVIYYMYMGAVAIFCPNSINIYAGVNGLEVGQSFIIGVLILFNDILYLVSPDHPAMESHLFSAVFLIPFLGVTCALLYHNWWPASVFVGDTYCYFAGMVYAVVGIVGHFSKTLLLFFVPQIFNFIYSAPQLFKIIDCPRHRLPHFNPTTGKLEPSRARLEHPRKPIVLVLQLLKKLHLLEIWWPDSEKDKQSYTLEISNMTIINLTLVILGPMREDKLTKILLGFQLFVGLSAIILRHTLAIMVFGRDNL